MTVYLKPNVQVDPLFNGWFAWNLLIPPVTAAFNTRDRHLKSMTSFVNAPAMHAAALKNPAMKGGAFIDLEARHVPEVRKLIEQTQTAGGDLLVLAKALTDLGKLLQEKAKGQPMESLYALVPEPLQGYVELVYDMNHAPSFRVLESLLYRGKFYAEHLQSVSLSLTTDDRSRPFMLSTPHLASEGGVELDLRFRDRRLDALFRMKREPRPFADIAAELRDVVADVESLRPFFTTTPPAPAPSYDGPGMRVRYFGHASMLIEANGVSVLTDPILSYEYPTTLERFSMADLPEKIDYVLLSHSHHDHVHFETLLQLRHMIGQIVVPRNADGLPQDPSLYLALKHTGFENLLEVRDMDEIVFPGGRIHCLPFLGEHHDLLVQSKSGYKVDMQGKSVLCIADSSNIDPQIARNVRQHVGRADLLFTGMECEGAPASWIYGPLFTKPLTREVDQSRRARGSYAHEALSLAETFGVTGAYTYAMGQEPWLSHILDNELDDESISMQQVGKFLGECKARGIDAAHLFAKREFILA
jgi:L-ascorbate metabolism protein UlaG (beta-lactamase superfamily)